MVDRTPLHWPRNKASSGELGNFRKVLIARADGFRCLSYSPLILLKIQNWLVFASSRTDQQRRPYLGAMGQSCQSFKIYPSRTALGPLSYRRRHRGGIRCNRARGCARVIVVLLRLTEEIRECYEHAWRARQKAERTLDPFEKEGYLDDEMRWITLAHSYELSEQISAFTGVRPGGGRRAHK